MIPKNPLKREQIDAIEVSIGMRTAILVDGSFFIKRYRTIYGYTLDAEKVANDFYTMVHKHVEGKSLYRILYYDCHPLEKKQHFPISKKDIDFSKTKESIFRKSFFEELKKKRKVALRLGPLKDFNEWILKPDKVNELLKGEIKTDSLVDDDFYYLVKQSGIDIKIGCDIASLAYKRLVQQIILIAGDSDFVPAAKVARREGIDFILDPMWNHIDSALHEHIDGLRSVCKKPPSQ